MASETYGLRLERTLNAPREAVFGAWTSRELRSRWLRPADDWTVPITEIDARAGGAYRDVFRSPAGESFTETGTFREVRAPERLVYTCRFEGAGVREPDMLVTIDLHDVAGRTRLVVTQEGYRERLNRDEQERGWPAFLDQLEKLLTRGA